MIKKLFSLCIFTSLCCVAQNKDITAPSIFSFLQLIDSMDSKSIIGAALRILRHNVQIAHIDPHGFNFAEKFKEVRAEILDAHKTGRGTKEEVIDNLNRMTQRFSEQLEKLNKEWLASIAPVTEPKNTADSA